MQREKPGAMYINAPPRPPPPPTKRRGPVVAAVVLLSVVLTVGGVALFFARGVLTSYVGSLGAAGPAPSASSSARPAGSAAADLEPLIFDRNPFEEE